MVNILKTLVGLVGRFRGNALLWGASALVIVALVSAFWAVLATGKANVSAAKNKSAQADLAQARGTTKALVKDAKARAKTDTKQSTQKAEATASVQAKRTETDKEKAQDETPRATASPSQLDRLRRLAAASNNAIRAASELPVPTDSNP